jgi:hypothetical protein
MNMIRTLSKATIRQCRPSHFFRLMPLSIRGLGIDVSSQKVVNLFFPRLVVNNGETATHKHRHIRTATHQH